MIIIDRMELEDVGGDPVKLAQAVLDQIPDNSFPIPVREIASALNIYEIKEENNISFEGALIAPDNKSEGAIIVRGDRSEQRKRFTIGHELGHYLNPWHKSDNPAGFQCTTANLAAEKSDKNNKLMRMEAEANEFSAELLMPYNKIKQFLNSNSGADIDHIIRLAELFEISKEAMARRYALTNFNDPTAVIFSKNKKIRYVKKHDDFPWLNVKHASPIPHNTISSKKNLIIGKVSAWSTASPSAWVDSKPNILIFEQTLAQANGFQITLLTYEVEGDSDDRDDIDLENSWTPKFARGR
ncbi:ImmA/IrrE family metallo-endopeptidase [Paremcibacter congregatus]|uniref:IrrE N-terminal-like domain-containing protein n=1 Tax=Paremcibacter congregatus TaxID=2043170 RepID=A0A2G4YT07_9PROT|nr:ImmA/IrrE family metallo-endopeptidase [Paremcibacter congregatus]PHZ84019.1 hypothetical protein CRD36_14060 [Paremcibacter congregatus]PHZ85461.1 hypothetical protein CRD36_06715 [Paremcibacter congregatus]QDE26280.1 ImmA/IrrE family metallo-endopeptidase [Paremcibacter congregatus]QDE28013.1 ImmA/IrrE family metallo-endopeptidase [Paremcibacter congregatus]